jgi:hypothetical protein
MFYIGFENQSFFCYRSSAIEHEEEDDEEVKLVEEEEEEEVPIDDNQIKLFSCPLCCVSFSKFEAYREHFVSTEHRYKRRDEKKRLGVCSIFYLRKFHLLYDFQEGCIIETSPVEVFVNLLLYNKVKTKTI